MLYAASVRAQAPGRFPPDSLINVKVIPKNTPVMQVVGMMRKFRGRARRPLPVLSRR